ncbi:hypothetical protein T4B_9369 [Trichinella pseudospiralis]|uniref:Uncharacterized protein n=1 Tax=Trichinella pseudospiralis TaxID=6337 RepID=A0A0V1JIQ5_TRIPS|nr:hypothetical protein T4B_9369 [Trichinella pseudospiralis]KRZ34856.1 hypothetical protein T4C_13237 [Trichinella pseudospiralis]
MYKFHLTRRNLLTSKNAQEIVCRRKLHQVLCIQFCGISCMKCVLTVTANSGLLWFRIADNYG